MNMATMKRCTRVLGVTLLWGIGHLAAAQETAFEIGFRPLVLLSQGEPSNDMVGGGITDTVAGATGTIGAHTPVGLSLTLSYRF